MRHDRIPASAVVPLKLDVGNHDLRGFKRDSNVGLAVSGIGRVDTGAGSLARVEQRNDNKSRAKEGEHQLNRGELRKPVSGISHSLLSLKVIAVALTGFFAACITSLGLIAGLDSRQRWQRRCGYGLLGCGLLLGGLWTRWLFLGM